MEIIFEYFSLFLFLGLFALGFVTGRIIAARHRKSLTRREKEMKDLLIFSEKRVPESMTHIGMVTGSVVLSHDYFQAIASSLRMIFGGQIVSYEGLLDRARREALLRMKAKARDADATMVFNVKYATAALGGTAKKRHHKHRSYGLWYCCSKLGNGVKYSNGEVPTEINDPGEGPAVKGFLSLMAISAVIFVVAFVTLTYLGSMVGGFIPFKWEVKIAEILPSPISGDVMPEASREMQLIADKLMPHMDLPKDAIITVSVIDRDTVNAAATLGGQIYVFSGLLDVVKSEQGRAFVLAHEIAHVTNRHLIKRVSGQLLISLAYAMVFGATDDLGGAAKPFVHFMQAGHSRDDEHESDHDGLNAVISAYGSSEGFDELFEHYLSEADGQSSLLAYLQTHPLTEDRLAELRRIADQVQ